MFSHFYHVHTSPGIFARSLKFPMSDHLTFDHFLSPHVDHFTSDHLTFDRFDHLTFDYFTSDHLTFDPFDHLTFDHFIHIGS